MRNEKQFDANDCDEGNIKIPNLYWQNLDEGQNNKIYQVDNNTRDKWSTLQLITTVFVYLFYHGWNKENLIKSL